MPKKTVVAKGKSASAPGQMAKTTGQPAKSFAPGQLKVTKVSKKK